MEEVKSHPQPQSTLVITGSTVKLSTREKPSALATERLALCELSPFITLHRYRCRVRDLTGNKQLGDGPRDRHAYTWHCRLGAGPYNKLQVVVKLSNLGSRIYIYSDDDAYNSSVSSILVPRTHGSKPRTRSGHAHRVRPHCSKWSQ